MTRLHVTAWTLALGLLIAFALYWRHEGVQAERSQRLYDSLSARHALLQAAADSLLARHAADSAREAGALELERVRSVALRASSGRLEALAHVLRDSLTAAQRVGFDSLEALHRQREALLIASRDSAWALFREAAAGRDTALSLLRASQQEEAGLQLALIQARRVPLLNKPIVKLATLGLAFALGKWGR